VLFSSLIALTVLLILKHDRKEPFPFGPFLIIGALVHILAGKTLIGLYLRMYNLY